MANWLQKILTATPAVPQTAAPKTTLPVASQSPSAVAVPKVAPQAAAQLPRASVIYAIAASFLFVIAVYFLLTGLWFTGGLVLLPAVCFLGFALHFLKA